MKDYGWILDDTSMSQDELIAKLLASEKDVQEEENMKREAKKRGLSDMADFDCCYKILKVLRDAMSADALDPSRLEAGHFGITENKRNAILKYLYAIGLIEGLTFVKYIGERNTETTDLQNLRITLKGLEFLEDNNRIEKASTFKKLIKRER